MLFRVLGDIAVQGDAGTASVPGRRVRALLALLVLEPNRVLSRDKLIDAIWGDDPPEHGDAALQVVMSRLRRAVGTQAAERIRFDGGGYRLDAGPEEIDVTRVEMLLRDGRAQLAMNDARRAAELLDLALGTWTGEPLADLRDFPFHAMAVRRLRELRFTVVEARYDAYLNAGRHLEVVADIENWTAIEPLREHLRGQQMTALYRCGRQADALAVASDLRKMLRDELGLHPSPALQELERRILDHDPTLLATSAGVVPTLPPWTSETVPFVGRERDCERVLDAMRDARVSGLHFLLIEGASGTGKSRLLLEVARRVGADAVVVPVDVHESLRPTIVALASGIDAALRRLLPHERKLVVGNEDTSLVSLANGGDPDHLQREAVTALQRLSMKAPVLVLIDDIDRAGASLLNVITDLALLGTPKRILVVATACPDHTAMIDRLYGALVRRGRADRIELGALTEDDLDEVLQRLRVAPRREVVRRLYALTRGDPFMLSELLNSGPPERIAENWPVPPRVRDVVLARVDGLGRGAIEVLRWCALVQFDFAVETIAAISGIAPSTVATMIERAVDAQIVQPSGALSYRFVHELARRTIAEDWPARDRADAHRRIAVALEAAQTAPGGLAAHWARATGPDAATKAAEYATLAGDDAMRVHAPSAAARWYDLALSRLDAGRERDRAAVLVRLAKARQGMGDPAFSDALREAATIARRLDDDDLVAQVVTATAPGFVMYDGFTRDETLPLLQRALAVPDLDPALRSRVLVRYADEQQVFDPAAARVAVEEALVLARRCGDPVALLHVLLRQVGERVMPETLPARERAIDEALPLALESRDVAAQQSLYGVRVITAIERADVERADEAIAYAELIADHYDLAPMRWSVMVRTAWRTALRGDLGGAYAAIEQARTFGEHHGIAHATPNGMLQRGLLRWQEGRIADTLPAFRSFDGLQTQLPGFALSYARALTATAEGRPEARAIVAGFGARGVRDLPQTSFWSTVLLLTAETSFLLALPDIARVVLDLLEPHRAQVVCPGNWVPGSFAYGAAIAAAAAGDARAPELFEEAVALAERLHAPLLRARAQLAWVRTTIDAPRRLRPAHADDRCAEALHLASEIGARPLAAAATRLLDECRGRAGD